MAIRDGILPIYAITGVGFFLIIVPNRKLVAQRRALAKTTRNNAPRPLPDPPAPIKLNQRSLRDALSLTTPDVFLALIPAAIGGIAYFPIVKALLSIPSDYSAHASYAQWFLEKGILYSPACFLHLLVAGIVFCHLASYLNATLAVTIASYASIGGFVYLYARHAFRDGRGLVGRLLALAVAIVLPFVQPLVRGMYQIGDIWTEPYYSPTYVLLKPLAITAAAFAVYFLAEPLRNHWISILLCALAVAAGTLTKPSFTICAVPAVVICAAYNYLRKQPFSAIGIVLGFVLPALAVLAWQQGAYTSDAPNQYNDSIVFAPLAVMRIHSSNLALKYFLSTLTPLSVLVFFGRRAWSDNGFRFSLIAFAFGTAYAYLLGEKTHLAAGNFLWSSYITMFVLNLFSIIFLLRQLMHATAATRARAVPCLLAVGCQFAAGVASHLLFLESFGFKFRG